MTYYPLVSTKMTSVQSRKSSPSHRLAQRLNNSAAMCIEIGHYGRAISTLKKALEVNKIKKSENNRKRLGIYKAHHSCTTLDGCILYSEKNSITICNGSLNKVGSFTKKRKVESSKAEKPPESVFWIPPRDRSGTTSLAREQNASSSMEEDAYIYCQPILIIDRESECIGGMLTLIIIFNLALAHHLEALDARHARREQDTLVRKTLLLYELACNCYLRLHDEDPLGRCSRVASIRFNMIIQNNLSQLHRALNNHQKYEQYQQQLLSSVMAVVEYNTRVASGGDSSSIDGFLTNATSMVLGEKQCAQAA